MVMANDLPPESELAPREPTVEDLRNLCRELNQRGAQYLVIGGFAMRAANYNRTTMDIDLMVDPNRENESKVFSALATLPDNAVRGLQAGDLKKYNVIRVGDEILVDLLSAAGGVDYFEAARDVVVRDVDGVSIPFASPRLLWRMKVGTHREKDSEDLLFLRQWFAGRGEEPPQV
jgi:predicted nucleotidyltransferase